ncbi:uncharacterized protein LOC117943446 [Scomber scombrus]|uniref:Uncharacterized protein LOC117943446 n=1 Tax=Scomber scombrus TaxID=13677 RepID=A0AAV1PFU4_SCOSC
MALEILIAALAGQPVLYDVSLFSYQDQLQKADAWKRVAEAVGLSETECKKKWKYLRDQFRKERKKEKERRKSGAAASKAKVYEAKMSEEPWTEGNEVHLTPL